MVVKPDVDLSRAFSDIDRTKAKTRGFEEIVRDKVDDAVEETAEEFREEVKRQIKASDIDSDTGELLESWRVQRVGRSAYRVRSTADHAIFLEVGTSPHTITADEGWLKFEPEPGTASQYPERTFNEEDGFDFGEPGLIVDPRDPLASGEAMGDYVAKSVQHPGNEAYRYFLEAGKSRDWGQVLGNKVQRAVVEARSEVDL